MNSTVALVTEQAGEGFNVFQFKTTELAIYSYYIESNKEGILIDPVFDVETYRKFMDSRKSILKYVFLTHYHADYLSGHTEFKVPIVMGPSAARAVNTFKVHEAKDGEILTLGSIKLKVIHTPGHTLESSCYQLTDSTNKDLCLFSGDTVFLGEVGRPDLACSTDITSQDLAGMLYDSIQKVKKLEGSMRLYPGHGSGSACGKSIGSGNFCTVVNQFTNNYGFKFNNKNDFVKEVAHNLPKPPKYFFYDAGLNQKGATPYDLALKKAHLPLTIEEFQKVRTQYKVVDTRVEVGDKGIVKGVLWLPHIGAIVNWMSNFMTPQQEFIILTEPGKQMQIINRYFRIGYFNIRGYNKFNVEDLKDQFVKPTILKFDTLDTVKDRTHLDVRSKPEWISVGVIDGAVTIPLSELEKRYEEVRGKKNIVINCMGGIRARVAFSILARHGIEAKVLHEEVKEFKNRGLPMVEYKE